MPAAKPYLVVDCQTGRTYTACSTLKAARRRADQLDRVNGASRFIVKDLTMPRPSAAQAAEAEAIREVILKADRERQERLYGKPYSIPRYSF